MRLPDPFRIWPGRWAVCVVAALSLSACGGGGGSGSSGSASARYTIGGTISGLNASGLVLTDNGADNLTVSSGASTFTFSQTVMAGGNYSVTVATQPAGETCTVSSGSGMANGNVMSVAVTCSVNTYTVGGTVTGLNASGLVLTDNGGDSLSVSSGATTFTFSQTVQSGGPYNVAVAAEPSGETCTVSSGSGTATANVTSVDVACTVDAYTVGGTVSGLHASGLVLTDNGGDSLSVASGATGFTFSQKVNVGGSYSVAIATQPSGETCTVASGSGTVSGNVTSVSVTCTVNMYSVGGTVSGLSAPGLVLADNGSNPLTVPAGASSFTFSTTLTSGATYDVAVVDQPTGETCTVSAGTGTITANVTNVAVSCAAITYTIGGTLSGLNGSGLVLQDNGGDNLTVNPGSTTFLFATPLTYGASYNVTVFSQPVGETCSVAAGSGTVSSDVTSVSVTCATNTYTITGTASSLTAAGLKLQFYSAGQVLSVTPVASGSASYTYSNVPYGTSIAMTIKAQPGWETCTASSGDFTGTVTGNVTGENLTCAADTPASNTVTTTGTTLSGPDGVAVDASGNVYVADTTNNEILMISPSGTVTQLATGASPAFSSPDGLAVDAHGNVFVADTGNNLVREIVATGGVVSASSSVITLSSTTTFNGPQGVAVDTSGNVYVADTVDNDIREIEASSGTVSGSSVTVTLAGGASTGCVDGSGASAEFDAPTGIAVGPSGNLYVADSNNNVIRKITSVGPTGSNSVTTWAGGAGTCDSASPASHGYVDGAATSQALFWHPTGVTVDTAGNVFVTDQYNSAVREITPAGVVSTIAGANQPTSGGTTTLYAFNLPFGITVNASDTLYVSNSGDNQIVTLAP